jgi:hypothetical protein
MKPLPVLSACLFLSAPLLAADAPAPQPAAPAPPAPAKPFVKITPGQVIVPTDNTDPNHQQMRRIWGELISLDLKTRTGKFRKEGTDEVMSFTVLPYAELYHHATFGDLQDFRPGLRAIFRLHQNDAGEWTWLTYISPEIRFLYGHGEYYFVDKIDPAKGELDCHDSNPTSGFFREKGILIETDANTRYWKNGEPAKFSDIQLGDKLRTITHGIGKGKVHLCWDVFLDDASLKKFIDEQNALEAKRLKGEGLPGYIDKVTGNEVSLTLFQEGGVEFDQLKPGKKIRVAPAGVDRKPTAVPTSGSIASIEKAGNLRKITLTLDTPPSGMTPTALARFWQTE